MEKLKEPKVVGVVDLSKFNKPKKQVKTATIVAETPKRIEQIHFFMDKRKKVVGRAESGKIAIISFDFKGQRIKADEDWDCEILEEEDSKVIVYPISLVKTAEQNQSESFKAIEMLKNKGFEKTMIVPKGTKLAWQTK